MGRGKNMRLRARQERLTILAERDRAQFDREWAVRLDSWAGVARRRANHATAFSVVRQAVAELQACGVADHATQHETRHVLTEAACAAVADVVDRRLYRLGNTGTNCAKARDGTHRLR